MLPSNSAEALRNILVIGEQHLAQPYIEKNYRESLRCRTVFTLPTLITLLTLLTLITLITTTTGSVAAVSQIAVAIVPQRL